MNLNKTEHRVRYSDTDHFGVVYYANYLNWFEAGRTEILRENGISYAELEKMGFYAPVVEVKVTYKNPGRYDDIIIVETKIESIGNSSVKFSYKLYRKNDEQLIAEAYTVNIFVNKEMKPVRVPDEVRAIIKA